GRRPNSFAPRSRRGPSARPPPRARRPKTRAGPSGTGSSRRSGARSARSRSSSRSASSGHHWMHRRISGSSTSTSTRCPRASRRTGSTDVADKDAIVCSYAEALFRGAAAEGELDAVERRLFAFAELLERETSVRDALLDPSLPIENKRQLIADTLRERANPLAVNLLGFLVEQGRAREIGRIVETLAEVVAATRERAVAEVRTAV